MKKSIIEEFKEFISRGNVMDMAVGVIIGSAFTAIVNSLVNDVISPVLGMVTGGIDFTDKKLVLAHATRDAAEVAVYYGKFIQNVINFLLISLVVFAMVKILNQLKFKKEEPQKETAPAPVAEDILLLREIRDSLKK